MKTQVLGVSIFLAIVCGGRVAFAAEPDGRPAFVFRDVGYFHRWSQKDQHEFTPARQEDLEKWSDMVTVNAYPSVRDGDALAAAANSVLENYKAHQARVIRTDSIPRTEDRPAEHLIAVAFARPDFVELAFARFRLIDGVGYSIVYSHRMYGGKIGDEVNAWVKTNGAATEKALMAWNWRPSPGAWQSK